MRAIIISDSHNLHNKYGQLPKGDILIFAGDFTTWGGLGEAIDFVKWFERQQYTYKICIAGNHDRCMENETPREFMHGLDYLKDTGITINGLKFWGSPYTPRHANMAFEYQRGEEARKQWNKIPSDTDILLTHCPPYGILDKIQNNHLGCEALLDRIKTVKPRLHIFGHIHENYGKEERDGTIFINASNHRMLWRQDAYQPPVELDI